VAVEVAQQHWTLQTSADSAGLPGGERRPQYSAWLFGGLVSALLAVIVFLLGRSRRRVLARLDAATTQLRSAERQAREQADLLTDVLRSIGEGVLVVDADATLVHHNPAAAPLVGDQQLFHSDGITPFAVDDLPLARVLRDRRSVEQVELTVGPGPLAGASLSVSAYPLSGGLGGAVAVFHDVTSRLRQASDLAAAEAAASQHAALLTAILDNISDGVAVIDSAGRLLLKNPAATDALGLSEEGEGLERRWARYGMYTADGATQFPTEDLPLTRALAGEATEQVEMVLRNQAHPNGITISVSARPLPTADGLNGAVAVFHDISASREREADLTAFAAVAAHDLLAPLTMIAGYAELLDDEITELGPDEVRSHLTRIRGGVERMRRLMSDLLNYATSRDARLDEQPLDLQRLVSDVVAERTDHLRANSGQAEPPALFPDIYVGPLPVVHADPGMIRQLLDNLIGNALKYTLPGQPARIDISATPGDNRVQIQIDDRGIGIPAADQPHVFTTFHRAAQHRSGYSGTGLGLAICQRIVTRHQGSIEAADNPGGGTRITFTLPTAQQHPTAPAHADARHGERPQPAGATPSHH
jgi:PAS domain S-box-containing protein